jgi:preprotein translocase subunit SecY
VPSLEKLQKEGEVGQQKITQYTRYLTVGLAFGQSFGYVLLFRSFGEQAGSDNLLGSLAGPKVLLIVISLTAGCTLLMWLGELITQRGIGNGISLMIFASIVSGLPGGIMAWWNSPDQVFVVMMPFIALAVIVAIVYVQEGQRRIPVQYARRTVGRRSYGGQSTYIPLKVNQSGVIPIIFAASLMALPQLMAQITSWQWLDDMVARWFDTTQGIGWVYIATFAVLTLFFTYFYAAIAFNPIEVADNMKKYGGFIPGIRPGRQTAEYLDKVLSRLTLPGSLYLVAVAVMPFVAFAVFDISQFPLGGASLLIMVGVALETMKQIEGQLMQHNYEGFLA